MRNAPILVIQAHSPFLLFLCVLRGRKPLFIFIPIYSVVYSIYTRTCTVATHPFASGTLRDNRKSYPYLISITKTTKLADLISTQLRRKRGARTGTSTNRQGETS